MSYEQRRIGSHLIQYCLKGSMAIQLYIVVSRKYSIHKDLQRLMEL
jgi:hypothetical protein